MIAKLSINHRGGEVFDVSQEPSDRCVLWGELIKEKERRFLKGSLREEQICFNFRDTFQISIRTVWRPESGNAKGMIHRKGKFAMLLHDTTGRLTTSWTWLKLVQPLYQMGLSVILVDLPGLGKSSINSVSTLHPSVWQAHEGHILCHILDELKVSKCHLVACGSSCSALIRMLKHSPHQLEKEHVLHNPVLDYHELFKDTVRGPAPGTGPRWRDILREAQQHELENFLVSSELKILATFDQAEYGRTKETYESFITARKHVVLNKSLTVTEVTREEVCEAQIGANVPVTFFFFGKEMRQRYAAALQSKANFMNAAPRFSATGNPYPAEGTLGASGMGTSKSAGALEGLGQLGNEAREDKLFVRTAGELGWHHTAFATGSDWAASLGGPAQQQRAFTSDAAKRECLQRLCGDPRDSRRRLLSALPSRTRLNIRATTPQVGLSVSDPEPATVQEEKDMIHQALRKSKQSYLEEMQTRKPRMFNV